MKNLILKVTNPSLGINYGEIQLKDLVKALSNPLEQVNPEAAMSMRYDLAHNELEFEIVNHDAKDPVPFGPPNPNYNVRKG